MPVRLICRVGYILTAGSPGFMVELVCCVKKVCARLREVDIKACSEIGEEGGSFHPGGVIGHVFTEDKCVADLQQWRRRESSGN